jgi:hypothetical protein
VVEASSWLASLPDDGLANGAASHAWNAAQWCLGELSYDKAASVWAKVGAEPWMSLEQFQRFSTMSSRNRAADQGLDGFLSALDKTWPAEEVTSQFDRWATQNPEATMDWLETAPTSAVTRAGIQGLVKALQRINPAEAAKWSDRIN